MAGLGSATVTATVDKGSRIYNIQNGGKVALLDVTLTTAANVIAPAGQIVLSATDLTKLGFRKLLAVLDSSGRTVGGTYVLVHATFDGNTNTIMLYDGAGAAMPAATIGDGGKLRFCLLGI